MRRIVGTDIWMWQRRGGWHLAGEVIIPPVVAKEFKQNAPDRKLPDWIRIKDLDEAYVKKAVGWSNQIDAGEAAAISLNLSVKTFLMFV